MDPSLILGLLAGAGVMLALVVLAVIHGRPW